MEPGIARIQTSSAAKQCLYHFQVNLGIGKTGFGYGPVDKDYKVLRMWFDGIELIEIYSLNTNTRREIKVGFDKIDYGMQRNMQVCYQGICYWFLSEGENATNMMLSLSFDLHAEKFHFIPLSGAIKPFKSITVWNDSIAYISSSLYGEGTEPIEMWVTECCSSGVGDLFSWTKYLSIVPHEGILRPLTFWKSDELILEGTVDEFSVSYNLQTKV